MEENNRRFTYKGENKIEDRQCYNCKELGHIAYQCPNESRQREEKKRENDLINDNKKCYICKKEGHLPRDCWYNQQSKQQQIRNEFQGFRNEEKKIKCLICDRYGHIAKDCWFKDKYQEQKDKGYNREDDRRCNTCHEIGHLARDCKRHEEVKKENEECKIEFNKQNNENKEYRDVNYNQNNENEKQKQKIQSQEKEKSLKQNPIIRRDRQESHYYNGMGNGTNFFQEPTQYGTWQNQYYPKRNNESIHNYKNNQGYRNNGYVYKPYGHTN